MSRQDRLATALDAGFTALESGELDEAAACLERARPLGNDHPDFVMLAAAVADAQGRTDDAVAHYRKLVELRPDDPMPRICLARLELHDLGDPDAALDTLEAAFDFIDDEPDLIEAIVVRTEALIAVDDLESARESLSELATSAIDDAELALDLAELALAAEDAAAAARWIETARATPAVAIDALHLLGRVHEARGDRAKMIAVWQEVRAADAVREDGPVTVSEDELERLALATLAELPEEVRARLEHVPILIDDLPSAELVADGLDPRMLGLFQGAAMPDDGALPTVTNILLFRKNLEHSARDLDHLAEEVRITVLHETAHYFGLDEDELVALGLD
jgi:predicted Zn-dependent protease with MMP-like domain/predicted Zn-dependent protease